MKSYRHLAVTDFLKGGWWLGILKELKMVTCYWKNKRSNLVTMWILASTSILEATPKILSTQKNSLIIHGLKLNSMLLIIIIMYRWYRIASALPIAKGKYVCSLEEHDTLGFRLFKTTANDAHYPAEISNTVRKQENRNRRKMWGGNESTGN